MSVSVWAISVTSQKRRVRMILVNMEVMENVSLLSNGKI
jgi:hypothetical protein